MVSVMFSVDLPLFARNRQDREYAAKLKELDSARHMREDARRMRSAEVQQVIRDWLGALSFPQGVRVAVDIDPYSFV